MRSATPLQTRIRSQLRMRFSRGMQAGDRINEAEIAGELGVSRTPVREVLRQFVQDGVLAYEPGRGFTIVHVEVGKGTADAAIADFLDERVMRDMALGEVSGAMSERALMERYRVSHGTLISTLRRLMRDHLVGPTPGRGWLFMDVGQEALKQSYRFRRIIEPATIMADGFAPDEAAFRALDAEHAAAIAGIQTADRRTLFELDARFHDLVARGAGTSYLVDAIQRQNNIRRVGEYIGYVRLERLRVSMEEHRGIIAALLRGERQMAAALMRLHLQISEAETFEHIDEDLERVRDGRLLLSHERADGVAGTADIDH